MFLVCGFLVAVALTLSIWIMMDVIKFFFFFPFFSVKDFIEGVRGRVQVG